MNSTIGISARFATTIGPQPMPPRFSTIIPAHDEEHFIGLCLESIRVAAEPYPNQVEVIVVLNRCSDRTEEIAPRWSPENRPYMVTSKPANEADPEQEQLYVNAVAVACRDDSANSEG